MWSWGSSGPHLNKRAKIQDSQAHVCKVLRLSEPLQDLKEVLGKRLKHLAPVTGNPPFAVLRRVKAGGL